jgi:hypothetical protein
MKSHANQLVHGPQHWISARRCALALSLVAASLLGACSGGSDSNNGSAGAGAQGGNPAAPGAGGAGAAQPIASGPAAPDCPASGASATAPASSDAAMHCAP